MLITGLNGIIYPYWEAGRQSCKADSMNGGLRTGSSMITYWIEQLFRGLPGFAAYVQSSRRSRYGVRAWNAVLLSIQPRLNMSSNGQWFIQLVEINPPLISLPLSLSLYPRSFYKQNETLTLSFRTIFSSSILSLVHSTPRTCTYVLRY